MSSVTVLHIFSGDLWAGAEVMVFNLLKELKNYKDVNIVALSLNEGILTKKLREIGVEVLVIDEPSHSFPGLIIKAVRSLKNNNIDIIHSHRYKENILAIIISILFGVKYRISTIHGMPEVVLYEPDKIQRIGYLEKLNYFLLRHFFSYVASVSKEMSQVLSKYYRFRKNRLRVVYNGIPLPENVSAINKSSSNTINIGTVGRMVPVKNFELFINIAAELTKKINNVQFTILGDGPLSDALSKKIKKLGIEEYVKFVKPVKNPLPYYQSLDIYLNTSHHEGIPLSILEAMACRKVVIAPNVGGIPEIIQDGISGMLVSTLSLAGYVNSCLKIIHDDNLKKSIENNAANRVQAIFTSKIMSASYYDMYRQLIA